MSDWIELGKMLGHLDRKLDKILRRLTVMAADQAALDQAIADLATHADAIDAAVQALIDKINSSPAAADFQAEVDALTAATGNLSTATDAANAALNPPTP
jgi:hypothetical protein